MFIRTTAINKLLKLRKRIKIIPGGTSAGKTFGILPILIDDAIRTPNLEISVVSESVPHLRKGALKDFLSIMKNTKRYVDEEYNRTLLTYHFPNGSYIEFFSADQEGKVRGPRRHKLYVNECNNISFETYHQLAIRTSKDIWLDFNPSNKFWVHEELEEADDVEWLTLTYKDNEALPESIVKEIEKAKEKAKTSKYWENWWNVYGLGQLGSLEGVVFSNWDVIDSIPKEARLVGYGLDFGYSNDPTAIIEVYTWNGKRILNQVCYQKELSNSDIAKLCPKGIYGYADSAEPKSIAELKKLGVMIKAAEKGRDSIMHGIQTMQTQEYLITRVSVDLRKEFTNYCFDTDRDGNRLNKPIDIWNHGIDAVRYHESMYFGFKGKTTKFTVAR